MRILFRRFLHCETVAGFSEEQKNELKNLFADFAKSFKQETPPETKSGDDKNKDASVIDQARKQLEADQSKANEIAEAEIAVKFDINFPKMREDYSSFMPAETEYVLKAVEAQNLTSKAQKVKAIKSGIMDAAFQAQKNIDVLNETQKAKIEKYKALSGDEKIKQANQYWEVFELAMDAQKTQARLTGVRNANGVTLGGSGDKSRDEMSNKIFAQSKNIVREFK